MPTTIEIPQQRSFWNSWNAGHRERDVGEVSDDQARVIIGWLDGLGRHDLSLIDVGCGTGWLSGRIASYGRVVATDLADDVVGRAADRYPDVSFRAGDFMSLDFEPAAFDVAVSCEVLSHVADQPAFLARIASLLRPGGRLMLATQNRPALELNDIAPPGEGQLRHWVDRREISELLAPDFRVVEIFSITPRFNRGLLRKLHSQRLARIAGRVGLGGLIQAMRRLEERAGLGWTLMVHAVRR